MILIIGYIIFVIAIFIAYIIAFIIETKKMNSFYDIELFEKILKSNKKDSDK